MENKELITRAKEIILKGAKQENIELPEFEITTAQGIFVNDYNPRQLLRQGFVWEWTIEGFAYWNGIYKKMPSTLNT